MSAPVDTRSVSMEVELPHPPEKVWRALTEPKLIAEWLMSTDLKPTLGHHFTFRTEPMAWWDGIVNCEVLEVERYRSLRYTWKSGPEASRLDTVVSWTLTPTASGGTRLALVHSGFQPSNTFAFDGAGKGWERNVRERMAGVLARLG